MLSDFIGRGLRTVEEWERAVLEETDTLLADQILDQLIKINRAIASTPAMEIDEIALKVDYIRVMTLGAAIPDIGEMEWRLIDSVMTDISHLATRNASGQEQAHSH